MGRTKNRFILDAPEQERDSAASTDMIFPDGSYARNFRNCATSQAARGNDTITLHGRLDNFILYPRRGRHFTPGLGNDTVNGAEVTPR